MPKRKTNALYAEWKPGLRAIAEKVHKILVGVEPKFEVGPAWHGIGYKQGSNYSCLLSAGNNHVKLMLWRGADLENMDLGNLRADFAGRGKNTRHLRFDTEDDVDARVLRKLLKEQHKMFASGIPYEDKPRSRAQASDDELPPFILTELKGRGVLDAYQARPPYQQRDYVSWITRAAREATQQKRLEQMLAELEAGDVYMKMAWGGA